MDGGDAFFGEDSTRKSRGRGMSTSRIFLMVAGRVVMM